jgi:hypothetical protein
VFVVRHPPSTGGRRQTEARELLGDRLAERRVLRTDDPPAEYGDALDDRFDLREGPVTEAAR